MSNSDPNLENQLRLLATSQRRTPPQLHDMQTSILAAVAAQPAPRSPWWRRWGFAIPLTLASAAGVMLYVHQHNETSPKATLAVIEPVSKDVAIKAVTTAPSSMILDGEEVDIASIDVATLDEALTDQSGEPVTVEPDTVGDSAAQQHLAPSSLQWVDSLPAADLDRLEQWLDSQAAEKG
jgi:hypothetical protein